jgi:hypothetical protein
MQLEQSPRPARGPTILDAIVLVAAAAVALALARGWEHPHWCAMPPTLGFGPTPPSTARWLHNLTSTWISWTIPFAMTLTAALLILRFRSPRPRFSQIAGQPGAVACAAAIFAMAARMGQEVLIYTLGYMTLPSAAVRLPSPPFVRYESPAWRDSWGHIVHNIVLETFPFSVSPSVGIAVIVAWAVLWANRRWCPELCWIDCLGRLLGIYWIVLAVAIALLSELWQLIS